MFSADVEVTFKTPVKRIRWGGKRVAVDTQRGTVEATADNRYIIVILHVKILHYLVQECNGKGLFSLDGL